MSDNPVPGVLRGLGSIIVASVVLIGLALLYFMLTAWIINFGVKQVIGQQPGADFLALSAALLTAGGLAGSVVRGVAGFFGPGLAVAEEDEHDGGISEVL